ncbi:hypothetical protein RDI58_018738 [Solanum bulbocastanum]|uniref:Uncharacterized protein n=1 Tax=Solanum bulbocastanum TaxID=147425 RepID=A0AAN8TB69_SOLBU
MNLDNVCYM